MKNVSIMSKETGVEFARVSINGETYLIRGDTHGTYIPPDLLSKYKPSQNLDSYYICAVAPAKLRYSPMTASITSCHPASAAYSNLF